jgi:glycosyltransferase involved in cell wall biosynthesis
MKLDVNVFKLSEPATAIVDERRIKIGIDGRELEGQRRGIGRYIFELCRELDRLLPNAEFYIYSREPIEMPVISRRWIPRIEPWSRARRLSPLLWLKIRGGALCHNDGLDAYWGSAVFLPKLDRGVRTVSTVYDLCFRLTPETFVFGHLLGVRMFFARDVRKADTVLSISEGTSARLNSYLGRTADAIVRPAVSAEFRAQTEDEVLTCRRTYGLSFPYILSVASWEPRKNLELLVRTVDDMKSRGLLGDRKLVLVGKPGCRFKHLESLLEHSISVLPLGYVPDEHLPSLYAGADAFVFPSIYEGFGIPVLEAQACGTRVVTSDIPELREAGGGDAMYIQPTEEGIRTGILAALKQQKSPPASYAHPTWREGAETLALALLGRLRKRSEATAGSGGE